MDFEKIRQYFYEFLEQREENIVPIADFREFLRQKGIKNEKISYIIMKLMIEENIWWYGEGRKYIIKDPKSFNEKEFLEKTSPLFTYLKTLIELQKINPNNFVDTRTLMSEYRKRYPKMYKSDKSIFRIIKLALCKAQLAECVGQTSYQSRVRLTDEFMKNYTPLTVEKYEEVRRIVKPYYWQPKIHTL